MGKKVIAVGRIDPTSGTALYQSMITEDAALLSLFI